MNHQNSSLPVRAGFTTAARRITKIGAVAFAALSIGAPLAQATGIVLTTNTLTIAPTGTLNLKDNSLIVKTGIAGVIGGGGPGLYDGIQGYVQRGLYSGPMGFWDGYGIDSSVAASNPGQTRAIGVLDNALAGYTDWPVLYPHPVTGTSILVKYTYFGDADLDGQITPADYLLIDSSVGNNMSDWVFGDFDYDGLAGTASDYLLIDGGFADFQINGPLVAQGVGQPVPEPGSIGLIGLGLLTLARRNRSGKTKSE